MQVANPTRPRIVLPTEILDIILDFLGGRKPTLAKCMRVSLQMYQVIAPRLYTHLDWSARRSFPLFLPTNSSSLSNRVSPTKSELFHLIRSFDLENHLNSHCKMSFGVAPLRTRLETLLRIPLLKYNTFGKAVTQGPSNHIDAPSSRCPILAKIAPKKLVIRSSYTEPLPIRYVDRGNLTEVVAFVGLVPLPLANGRLKQKRQPFCKKSPTGKNVVYIISSMDRDGILPQLPPHQDHMACFREHVMEVLFKPHFALDVYIANGAGRAMESAGKTGYSYAKLFAALRADILSHEKLEIEKVREYWKTRRSGGTPLYKSIWDMEHTDIHFMDSREYLENWDTDGEFTDEERIRYMGKSS